MGVKIEKNVSEKIFDVVNIIIMSLVIICTLYPILNMLAISLSDDVYVLTSKVTFYPRGLDLDAYKQVFSNNFLMRAYKNTILVALLGVITSLPFTSFAAYPLAFSNFHGKKFVSFFIVFTMWFHGGMIPNFIVMRNLGLINNYASLILSSLISAYNVIILRNFYETIPSSLIESAKIDGANDFLILGRIVWPLSKPVLAILSLWTIVGHWNSFMTPLLYLNDHKKYTLQLVLRDIVLQATGAELYGMDTSYKTVETSSYAAINEQTKNAVVFVSMVPMLILYPFLQKYFVKGIMLGAVKG